MIEMKRVRIMTAPNRLKKSMKRAFHEETFCAG